MDELIRRGGETAPETEEVVSAVIRSMVAPLMESIGEMLRNNTEAMEQIAAAQQMTSQRIADLERRVRLRTPMSKAQEKYIGDAIRARARELLDGRGYAGDKKAVTRLSSAIRKSVLARWGVASMRDAPSYDYETAMKQISLWNDMVIVRDVVKEARKRESLASAQQPAGLDGSPQASGLDDPTGLPCVHDDLEG